MDRQRLAVEIWLELGHSLRQISDMNDWVQARFFDPNRLAPKFPAPMVLPPRFDA